MPTVRIMNERRTAVLVFARAPVPGAAKTRLAPLLGDAGAADASARLTLRALSVALEADIGPVELWCAPDCTHPFFTDCRERLAVALHAQSGCDIGARMTDAFDHALRNHARVVLIGADAVSLQAADLIAAADALTHHDAVFAPAEDGGYLLVGLNAPQPGLFEDIDWDGPEVWRQTCFRIAALGLRCHVLATGYDVDQPQDYQRALADGLLEDIPC